MCNVDEMIVVLFIHLSRSFQNPFCQQFFDLLMFEKHLGSLLEFWWAWALLCCWRCCVDLNQRTMCLTLRIFFMKWFLTINVNFLNGFHFFRWACKLIKLLDKIIDGHLLCKLKLMISSAWDASWCRTQPLLHISEVLLHSLLLKPDRVFELIWDWECFSPLRKFIDIGHCKLLEISLFFLLNDEGIVGLEAFL